MGRGPAGALACLFYGLPVRTRSLILASIAYRQCRGAFKVLDKLRRAGCQDHGPAAKRMPVEVWDKVEQALVAVTGEDAEERGVFKTRERCWPCNTRAAKWVKLDEFVVMPGEEGGSFQCRGCGKMRYYDKLTWHTVLEDEVVQKLIDSLLRPYGLALPTTNQYTLSRHGCAPPSTACFISLSYELNAPVHPAQGRTIGFDTGRSRGMFYAESFGGYGDGREQDDEMLVEAPRDVPEDADEMFESLRKDWPLLEYLAFRDAKLRFDAEEGDEKEKVNERVRPSWRVFTRAVDYSD
ncbi:hypothetical protein JCM10213_005378 [Rhodosporidiobolus nylandii]